jgi:trimeric autotransporter adhesin
MASTVYQYRTPAEFPDFMRLGDSEGGTFSEQQFDATLKQHKIELYSATALLGTWAFGSDGLIRFNGDALDGTGVTIGSSDLAAINTVSTNIAAVLSCQTNADAITDIAASIASGEFADVAAIVTDAQTAQTGAEAAQTAAEAASANSSASAAAASASATGAAASATTANTAAASAAASEATAQQWASAASDVEPAPGLKSARGYAELAQGYARAIAGIPSREVTGASTSLVKSTSSVRGDEFAAIYCTGATNKTIDLIRDFNTTPALDGSPSWVPLRIIRTGAGTVTLQGSATTVISSPELIGEWQAGYITAVDPPTGATAPIVRTISVPAGLKRFLFVTSCEINQANTSHEVTLTSSTGTVTARTAATAPTSDFSDNPCLNVQSWTVSLGDSATVATSVTLTFTMPDLVHSHAYNIRAVKNVNAVSGATGANQTAATTGHSVSVTAAAGDMVLATMFHQGDARPATFSGGTAGSQLRTGGRTLKDSTMIPGYLVPAAAGANAMTGNFTGAKQGAVLGICFEAATSGASAVTVIGTPLTIGSNSWVDVMALSDGTTYLVRHGT